MFAAHQAAGPALLLSVERLPSRERPGSSRAERSNRSSGAVPLQKNRQQSRQQMKAAKLQALKRAISA